MTFFYDAFALLVAAICLTLLYLPVCSTGDHFQAMTEIVLMDGHLSWTAKAAYRHIADWWSLWCEWEFFGRKE